MTTPVLGAFNLAADPVITPAILAEPMPAAALVTAARLALRARLAPAPPELVELFLSLPVLDWGRAQRELGWTPPVGGRRPGGPPRRVAYRRQPPTAPLDLHAGGPGRLGEVATGVGGRDALAG